MVEHIAERLPQQFQIILRKAGALGFVAGERSRNIAMNAIKTIGDDMFATHGAAALFLGVLFGRGGHAGDGDFQRQNGFDRAGEGELHGSAHLACIDASGHDRAKGAHVPEIGAHPSGEFARLGLLLGQLLELFCLGHVGHHRGPGFLVQQVEGRPFRHVNAVVRRQRHIVAHLALERHIADQPQIGFRVEPGHVAGIGIAIGIAVGDIEIEDEFIAVGHSFGHCSSPMSVWSSSSAASGRALN